MNLIENNLIYLEDITLYCAYLFVLLAIFDLKNLSLPYMLQYLNSTMIMISDLCFFSFLIYCKRKHHGGF